MLVLIFYPFLVKWFYPQAYQKKTVEVTAPGPLPVSSAPVVTATEIPALGKAPAPAVALLENDFYKIEFSTLGGTITNLSFLGEKGREELTKTDFFSGEANESGIFGLSVLHEKADLAETIFKMVRRGGEDEVVEFVYELPGAYRVTKTYTVHKKQPVVDLVVRVKNLSEKEKHFPLTLNYGMNYEKGFEKNYGYYDAAVYADKLQTKDLAHIKKKGFFFPEKTVWAGFIKKYFALLVKPAGKILEGTARADEKALWGEMTIAPLTVSSGDEGERSFLVYAGPQRYEELKSFGAGFEEIFSRGFFGIFRGMLFSALRFFYRYTHNFGWAIVLLTLLVKLIFAYPSHAMYANMRKMQALAPKMKAIQEHHKKDPAKSQQELMALYRRNKVNPMMGCLPMIIQAPIFIAMYQLLTQAVELHGAPFIGWITDLSAPDRMFMLPFSWNLPLVGTFNSFNLLPLLMAASQVWYQKLMPSQPGSNPEQKMMMNIMPLAFGIFCYNMPSGLTLYWTLQNFFSIIQQVFINRIVIVLHHEDQ